MVSTVQAEERIDDYYVFEVDRNLAGCAALHVYAEEHKGELACVCVDAKFENHGIGGKLMQYVEGQARSAGLAEVFCLSTQAFNYFVQKGGYQLGSPADLPPPRRERYEQSGRRSQVLTKAL